MRVALRTGLLLVATLFSGWVHADGESYKLFLRPNDEVQLAVEKVKSIIPPNAELCIQTVPAQCNNVADAQAQAKAILNGVRELPCLVICDDKGPYAVLSYQHLSADTLQTAHSLVDRVDREKIATEQEIQSRLFLVCAMLGEQSLDDATLELIIQECRLLLKHPHVNTEQKQFIGYKCLYPALMLQYARAYKGAHTPYSEKKLLEAINELENARDVDPKSKLGRHAYAERERLRSARLKAKKYE